MPVGGKQMGLFAQDKFLLPQTLQEMFSLRREDLWVENRKCLLSFHSPAALPPPLSCVGKILENAIVVIMAFILLSKSFHILFPADFFPDDWVFYKTLYIVSPFQVLSPGADTLVSPSGGYLSLRPFLPLPASHLVEPTVLVLASIWNTVLYTKPSFWNKGCECQEGGYRECFTTSVIAVYSLEKVLPLLASWWVILFLQPSSPVNPCTAD